jgi:hypothetical protein
MAIEQKLIKVKELDDPRRCQAPGAMGEGQCEFLSVEGFKYCEKHGGTSQTTIAERKRVHDYRLKAWQTRIDEFAESNNVKNLRGEIAVLRHLLEEIHNQCSDSTELILYSGRLSDLTMKINTLVVTCQKFEANAGLMLDKSAALLLASKVVEVIGQHVTDAEVIDKISNGIIDIISEIGK